MPSDVRSGIINPKCLINGENITLFDFMVKQKYTKGVTFMVAEMEFEPPIEIKSLIDDVKLAEYQKKKSSMFLSPDKQPSSKVNKYAKNKTFKNIENSDNKSHNRKVVSKSYRKSVAPAMTYKHPLL